MTESLFKQVDAVEYFLELTKSLPWISYSTGGGLVEQREAIHTLASTFPEMQLLQWYELDGLGVLGHQLNLWKLALRLEAELREYFWHLDTKRVELTGSL